MSLCGLILLLLVGSPFFMTGQISNERSVSLQTDVLSGDINKINLEVNSNRCFGTDSGSVEFLISNGDYYIDSENGNDSNTGTSPDQPWASLTPVNNSTFTAGDTILFARGSEFEGILTVKYSGISGNPIVFGAYGSGPKPKLFGSKVITGWTPHDENIWKANVDEDDIKQLFLDDERMKLARYPDEGYFTVTSKTSNSVFASGDLDGDIDYTRATCFVKSKPWTIAAIEVSSSNSKTITLSSDPTYGIAESFGFWLVNKLEFLTKAGEWYYDLPTKTLYFWPPDGDFPDNHIVRASVFLQTVYISEKSFITVQDIELAQAGTDEVFIASSNNIQIRNCTLTNPDRFGIYANSTNHLFIDSNSFKGANNGVRILLSENAIITNNLFQNTGHIGNLNKTIVDQALSGILVRGDNHIIHYNRIINTGYIGINSSGLNVNIKYNYINGACQALDDGAGIYVTSSSSGSYPKNDFTVGTIIEGNIVENVHGTMEGKPSTSYPHGNGIYLDWSPKGIIVRNNIVNFVSQGLYIQGGGQHIIEKNIFMDGMLGYRFNHGIEEILFSENIIYQTARLGRQLGTLSTTAHQKLVYSNTGTYGKYLFDDNIYVARYSQENLFRYTKSDGKPAFSSDFSDWKNHTGQDVNSKFISVPLEIPETERIIFNDTKLLKISYLNNASNVTNNITGEVINSSFQLEPFTAFILKGLNLDCILDYEDTVAPVITDFTLAENSAGLTVTPVALASTGDATAYILTESASEPNLYDSGWSLNPSYKFNSKGQKTVYAWARDAAGNISSSLTSGIIIF